MSAAQLLLKKGLLIVGQAPKGFFELVRFYLQSCSNIYVISAVLLTIITALAWIQALSRTELTYIFPFMALSYVIVTLFSMWMFSENVTAIRWIGIVVVCIGVFLVSRS